MTINKLVMAGLACAVLAGCGGSSDPALTPREAFLADGRDFRADSHRLEDLQDTTARYMPSVGSVTYTGSSEVVVDTATETTFMYGDATMTADFAAETVTGSISNLIGGTGPTADAPGDAALDNLVSYAGTLDLSNGDIGDADASDISANFGGTLTGGGNTFVFDGFMFGVFKGNPAMGGAPNIQGALVESASALTTVTANGVVADGAVKFEVSK